MISIWHSDNWDADPIIFDRSDQQESSISTGVWNQDGTIFVTGGDSSICVWSIEQGLLVSLPPTEFNTYIIRSIQWCPHFDGFAAGSHDGSIQFWQCNSSQLNDNDSWERTELTPRTSTRTYNDRIEGITMVQFTSDGKYLVSARVTDSIITVWCTKTKEKLYEYAVHRGNVFTLLPHPTNPRLMITGGYDGLVTIFDVVAGKLLRAFMTNVTITDGSFSSLGDFFAFSSANGTITLFGTCSTKNYKNTPTSQFFASEQNPLSFDSSNIAMDNVLHVLPHQVPREIGDRLGRVHEDMPSVLLGPVAYEVPPEIPTQITINNFGSNHNNDVIMTSLSSTSGSSHLIDLQDRNSYDCYIRNIELHRKDIIDDGSVPDRVDHLFPVLEEPSPPPASPIHSSSSSSDEEVVEDDDDDDWEGSSRILNESTSHTLRTRRRTYEARRGRGRGREESSESSEEDESDENSYLDESVPYNNERRTSSRQPSSSSSTTQQNNQQQRRSTRSEKKYPEWVTTVKPIHNAYIPQIHDEIIYFVEGHQQYMDTYRERSTLIPTNGEPFVRCFVEKVSFVPVNYRRYRTKVRFELQLRILDDDHDPENDFDDDDSLFTIYYHPLSKCPDFLILASLYDFCSNQNYIGKRFRMFYPDNEIYFGRVINVGTQQTNFVDSPWESLQVEWERTGIENDNHVSMWEVELLEDPQNQDQNSSPLSITSSNNANPNDSFSVLQALHSQFEDSEDDIVMDFDSNVNNNDNNDGNSSDFEPMDLDSDEEFDFPIPSTNHSKKTKKQTDPTDTNEFDDNESSISIITTNHGEYTETPDMSWLRESEKIDLTVIDSIITKIRKLFDYPETQEFRFPIDLQILPNYYTSILSAIDLSTIIARLENNFYRRTDAVLSDLQLLEDNALIFNGATSWFYKVSHVIRRVLFRFINGLFAFLFLYFFINFLYY